jgi:hypothetical protein
VKDKRPLVPPVVSISLAIVMVVLYVGLGTTIIFSAAQVPNVPPLYAQIFGVLLIVYGLFRGRNVYRKHFTNDDSDD